MCKKVTVSRSNLPRDKNSPWKVRWRGDWPAEGNPKHYCKSFRLKAEAETYAAQKTMVFAKGGRRDKPDQVTLGEFCRKYLSIRKPELRPETVKLYENTINRLLNHFGPEITLSKITPVSAAEFIAQLKRNNNKDGELSPSSRARTLRNCKTMFALAVTWEMVPKNPFADIKRPKCVPKPWYYLNPTEYKKLLGVAPIRWKGLIALGYTCGLRLGEILSLTWDDIDFDAKEVRIENKAATATRPPFYIKDSEARTIPIIDETLDILAQLRGYNELTDQTPYVALNEQQYKTLLAKWEQYRAEKRPWRNQDGQNNTLTTFKRYRKKAGIDPGEKTLAIHTLRKCAGKNWAKVNRDPKLTQKLMGHSDIKTTLTYYDQITQEDRAEAAVAIGELLKESETSLA